MKLLEFIFKYTKLGFKFTFTREDGIGNVHIVYDQTHILVEKYFNGKKYGIILKLTDEILLLEEKVLLAFLENELTKIKVTL